MIADNYFDHRESHASDSFAEVAVEDFQVDSVTEVEVEFRRLIAIWKARRDPTSMASRMVALPSYQAIVAFGKMHQKLVTRLLISELKRDPDEWFHALIQITGVNPVSRAARGYFDRMVQAWIQWGKQNDTGTRRQIYSRTLPQEAQEQRVEADKSQVSSV